MDIPDTVRIAGPADIPDLYWHLLTGDHQDPSWRMGWVTSPKKLLALVQECCHQQNAVAGIIDGLNGIIGSIGIQVYTPHCSDDEYLSQSWMFVNPEHRNGAYHAQRLFDFQDWYHAETEARLGKSLVMETAITSQDRLPAKIRLLRSRAGRQVGAVFWKGDVAEKPQP